MVRNVFSVGAEEYTVSIRVLTGVDMPCEDVCLGEAVCNCARACRYA